MEGGEGGGYVMRYFTITRRSAISWIGFLLYTLAITRVAFVCTAPDGVIF